MALISIVAPKRQTRLGPDEIADLNEAGGRLLQTPKPTSSMIYHWPSEDEQSHLPHSHPGPFCCGNEAHTFVRTMAKVVANLV